MSDRAWDDHVRQQAVGDVFQACDWCEEPMAPEDVRYFEAQEDMTREAVCGRCAEEWAKGQVRPNEAKADVEVGQVYEVPAGNPGAGQRFTLEADRPGRETFQVEWQGSKNWTEVSYASVSRCTLVSEPAAEPAKPEAKCSCGKSMGASHTKHYRRSEQICDTCFTAHINGNEPAKCEAPEPAPHSGYSAPTKTWEQHLLDEEYHAKAMRDHYDPQPSEPAFPPPPPRTTFDAPVAVGGPLSLSSRWR